MHHGLALQSGILAPSCVTTGQTVLACTITGCILLMLSIFQAGHAGDMPCGCLDLLTRLTYVDFDCSDNELLYAGTPAVREHAKFCLVTS